MASPRQWQVAPSLKKSNSELAELNLPFIIEQILHNRGLDKVAEIRQFLGLESFSADLKDFSQLSLAVEVIVKHIKAGNLIVVYGDYDADGVTASTILLETLAILKAKTRIWLPDRVTEGYGLNTMAIDELADLGAKLIITVDTGIRNKQEVAYAQKKGLEVIVTDHHRESPEPTEWPDCLIINSTMAREKYPCKFLAGVGVAYKLVQAILERSTLSDNQKKTLERRCLDLVALGTIADCVPLLMENRQLVKEGIEIMNTSTSPRIGLKELARVAQISGEINEWNISWQLAPRINVAGRLDHANSAYRLLTTKDRDEAAQIADDLNQKNNERQQKTQEIIDFCLSELLELQADDSLLVFISPRQDPWPEGIIGLVAGRLAEKTGKPVLVITKSEQGYKGSGRSNVENFSLIALLEEVASNLDRYGGHAGACGFNLKVQQLPNFLIDIKKLAVKKLAKLDLQPKLLIDAELPVDAIDMSIAEWIEKLAPFGQGNPEPKFVAYHEVIDDINTAGISQQHLKLRFGNYWALAFRQAENYSDLRPGQIVNIVYNLEINRYNSHAEPQLKIIDLHRTDN
ncbi:MAG TPA: single-stranded-DNA-specific exonuclease RecJ [bacterium]|nr:single-stranded-DNA-specific exonuclease RecJ [bacterium]HOR69514.1 single-stranded-DNA-specific exonuclease RecJ [bacterium]HOS99219.1 single-stranded-DNA-specific exonuclease RecJ [bacterium]HPD03257.1 single-stranded-DNA-specific exonuclease RecJ [bacterium]HPL83556.1 single-stranded-DNA-specific exonuclease RecJ [bacterium]